MNIVTGYRGEAHITSQQDQAKNQGIFGSGSYVLDVGQKLRAEAVSANEVRIYDGVLSHQGVVAVVEKNTYDSVTITSGSQGADRCDLIVARYTKEGSTGVESMTFEVIMGMEGSSTPPDYNTGDIQSGDSPVDMPIYEVHLSGIQIESLVPVASQIGNVNGAFTMNDILPSGDVNAATTPGAYELVATNTYTNLPTGITSGVLTVSKAREGGFITQLLTSGTRLEYRTLTNSWSRWICVFQNGDAFLPGSYTGQIFYGVSGYVTSDSQEATFAVPINVVGATAVSIEKLEASLRKVPGGYIGGSTLIDLTAYIDTVALSRGAGIIRVVLKNSSGWGATNNTPIAGFVRINFTLT